MYICHNASLLSCHNASLLSCPSHQARAAACGAPDDDDDDGGGKRLDDGKQATGGPISSPHRGQLIPSPPPPPQPFAITVSGAGPPPSPPPLPPAALGGKTTQAGTAAGATSMAEMLRARAAACGSLGVDEDGSTGSGEGGVKECGPQIVVTDPQLGAPGTTSVGCNMPSASIATATAPSVPLVPPAGHSEASSGHSSAVEAAITPANAADEEGDSRDDDDEGEEEELTQEEIAIFKEDSESHVRCCYACWG